MDVEKNALLALRMKRMGFLDPTDPEEYDRLFADLSPVSGLYWSEPGSPPILQDRTDFDQCTYNNRRRAAREIIKGRFQGGNVGYIYARELPLFAAVYRKEAPRSMLAQEILDVIEREGPVTVGLLKHLTGALVKQITPELHKLQQAFLVFEDQSDGAGDRGFYLLSGEFPNAALDQYPRTQALKELLMRFARRLVFFTPSMAGAFYRLPKKEIATAAHALAEENLLLFAQSEKESGFILPGDAPALKKKMAPPQLTISLNRSDCLIKALEPTLKGRFSSEHKVLDYLLIDGEIQGASVGRFSFGPPKIEDVLLDLPPEEREARKAGILSAIKERLGASPRRYCGKAL